MKPTLADSLEIILPHFSLEIVTPEALSRLQKLAQLSAPIHRAGFEVRLGAGSKQVDLQQGIFAKDNEHKILADHIATAASSSKAFEQSAWNRIGQFCEVWSNPLSCLHEGVTEIWLEFDLDDSAPQTLVPSVFIALNRHLVGSDKALKIAETALELLWGQPIVEPLQSNLHHCFTACLTPARISHIGVMLSRQIKALRVNVSWLPPDQIASYLKQVGWPGRADEIETLAVQLLDVVDQVRICLDIGTAVYPKLGLECFFDQQHGLDTRWLPFLDDLVARGLCTPEKRDALLAWPGYTTPSSSSHTWLSHLIAESLLRPPDQLSIFERGLSHIKLIYQPQRCLEAKGYLGFLHRWLETDSAEDDGQVQDKIAFQNGDCPSTSEELDGIQLNASIAAATRFLINSRNQGGWWRDFDIKKGRRSDEWVTAYIGTALAALPDEQAHQAAHWAWSLLVKRRQLFEGWGYNAWVPPDADSTVWALRLASAVGAIESEWAQGALHFLAQYLYPNGGLATYVEELAPRAYVGSASVEGWCSVHTCVTAAAAGVDSFREGPLRFLRNTQREDGSWKSFWWYDDEYATALACEALARNGHPKDCKRVQLAVQWAVSRINSSGAVNSSAYANDSAFATAWCVRTIALADIQQHIRTPLRRAINWLIENQKSDGSWKSSAMIRAFSPDVVNPDKHPGYSYIFPDDRRLFTTATVLAALSAVQTRSVTS